MKLPELARKRVLGPILFAAEFRSVQRLASFHLLQIRFLRTRLGRRIIVRFSVCRSLSFLLFLLLLSVPLSLSFSFWAFLVWTFSFLFLFFFSVFLSVRHFIVFRFAFFTFVFSFSFRTGAAVKSRNSLQLFRSRFRLLSFDNFRVSNHRLWNQEVIFKLRSCYLTVVFKQLLFKNVLWKVVKRSCKLKKLLKKLLLKFVNWIHKPDFSDFLLVSSSEEDSSLRRLSR